MAFVSGWDVTPTAFEQPNDIEYFSIYPNNLFLRSIFSLTTKALEFSGIGNLVYTAICSFLPKAAHVIEMYYGSEFHAHCAFIAYMFVVLLNIILVTVSVLMITLTCKKIMGDRWGFLCFFVSAVFVGLMPWILVPYSDTFALFFVTSILFTYVTAEKLYIKWPVIVALTVFGYNIKPTAIFALLAIACIELFELIRERNVKFSVIKNHLNKYIKAGAATIAALCLSLCLVGLMKASTGIQRDESLEFGMLDFLMMGTNPTYQGDYNLDDVAISKSATSVEQRHEVALAKITENLQNMGPGGVIKLAYQKTMLNFGDGSFNWEGEGNFKIVDVGLFQPLKDFFDNYQPLAQVAWFIILIGCCFCVVIKRPNKQIAVVCLSVLFLAAFLTVFECGSRYPLLYLNYFIFASLFGWRSFFYNKLQLRKCLLTT